MNITDQLAEHFQSLKKDSNAFFKLIEELQKLEKDKRKNFAQIKEKIDQLVNFSERERWFKLEKKQTNDLARLKQECEKIEKEFYDKFGTELEKLLLPLDLKLSGSNPNLQAGFFTFKLDLRRAKIVICFGKEERLGECSLNSEELIKQIQNFQKELGCKLDCGGFIEKIKHILNKHPKNTSLPIIDMLLEMAILIQNDSFKQNPIKEHYRNYSRADFSYDLFRCREKFLEEKLKLIVATRQYTQHNKDYLWIPRNSISTDGTTFSHLEFQILEDDILL